MQSLSRPNAGSPLPYVNIVLPSNITSLSLDLFTTSPQALSYTITVAGNQYYGAHLHPTHAGLLGDYVHRPDYFLQLTLAGTTYNSSSNELIDNFSFGVSDLTAAPEAGTISSSAPGSSDSCSPQTVTSDRNPPERSII